MPQHSTATRKDWLKARLELLNDEKELTRSSDELVQKRIDLPWVQLDKDYKFQTENGERSLQDLLQGRSQLLVYHFMFGPEFKSGCVSCSSINGIVTHLTPHDVMFWAVSRAPLGTLLDHRKRMGWTFPWASLADTDFNADFNVSFSEEQQRKGEVVYNYTAEPRLVWHSGKEGGGPGVEDQFAAMSGTDAPTYHRDRPSVSAFVLKDGMVYHTYSAYGRGVDSLCGMYQWLDRVPKGCNETGLWWKRHDEYDK